MFPNTTRTISKDFILYVLRHSNKFLCSTYPTSTLHSIPTVQVRLHLLEKSNGEKDIDQSYDRVACYYEAAAQLIHRLTHFNDVVNNERDHSQSDHGVHRVLPPLVLLLKLLCGWAPFLKACLASNMSDLEDEDLVRQRCH